MDLPRLLVDVGAHSSSEFVQPPGAGVGNAGGGAHVVHHLTLCLLGEGLGPGELAWLGSDHAAVLNAGVVGAVVPPAPALPLPDLVPVPGNYKVSAEGAEG